MWKGLLGNFSQAVQISDETSTTDDVAQQRQGRPATVVPVNASTSSSGVFDPPRLPPSPRPARVQRKEPADEKDKQAVAENGVPATNEPARNTEGPDRREHTDSGQVQGRSCTSLVETTKSGGIATLLLFEQSEKRPTLETVLPVITRGIFAGLPVNHTVKTTVLEMCGPRCIDLMDDPPSQVRIVDTDDGSVRFVNALSVACLAPDDLMNYILAAMRRMEDQRDAEKTWFSRHLVCRIVVMPPRDAPACIRQGTLTLLDCAGTPRSDVDASVWALKECLRASASDTDTSINKPPYSHSSLTRCLRESLEREDAICQVIDANTKQTERTMEALHPVTNSNKNDSFPTSNVVPPKKWDHSTLCDWLISRHLIHNRNSVQKDTDGRRIMRMSKAELQNALCSDDPKKADLLYRCLRADTDRVARLEVKRRMAINRSQQSG